MHSLTSTQSRDSKATVTFTFTSRMLQSLPKGRLVPINEVMALAQTSNQENTPVRGLHSRLTHRAYQSDITRVHTTFKTPRTTNRRFQVELLEGQMLRKMRLNILQEITGFVHLDGFDANYENHSNINYNFFRSLFSDQNELIDFFKTIQDPHAHIMAFSKLGCIELIEVMFKIKPQLFQEDGYLYLSQAAENGQLTALNRMLAFEPLIPCLGPEISDETPLHGLCTLIEEDIKDIQKEWTEAFDCLISRGCSITQETADGENAADIALRKGNYRMVRYMLSDPSLENKEAVLSKLKSYFSDHIEDFEYLGNRLEMHNVLFNNEMMQVVPEEEKPDASPF